MIVCSKSPSLEFIGKQTSRSIDIYRIFCHSLSRILITPYFLFKVCSHKIVSKLTIRIIFGSSGSDEGGHPPPPRQITFSKWYYIPKWCLFAFLLC